MVILRLGTGLLNFKKKWTLEKDTGGDRFVSIPRMNSWIKAMAHGMDIKLSERITRIEPIDLSKTPTIWRLHTEAGESYVGYDYVVIAILAPQAEVLLSDTGVVFDAPNKRILHLPLKQKAKFYRPQNFKLTRNDGWEWHVKCL